LTARPLTWHRHPVPLIPIDLPDELCQRLLSCSPPLDVTSICRTALEEALSRCMSSCMQPNKALERPIMSPTIKTKAGRPPPPVRKSKKSLYLDEQVWQALDAVSKANADEGISSAANRLLRKSLLLDGD